jgi:hypothetical protein
MDDEAFRNLKKSLRQHGCVTNGFLKENVHFYVRHVKDVRERGLGAARGSEKGSCSLQPHMPSTAAA